jgi:hypothetical protein
MTISVPWAAWLALAVSGVSMMGVCGIAVGMMWRALVMQGRFQEAARTADPEHY